MHCTEFLANMHNAKLNINYTPLFMIQFENTKLWANPPVISGLPNKIWGLNGEKINTNSDRRHLQHSEKKKKKKTNKKKLINCWSFKTLYINNAKNTQSLFCCWSILVLEGVVFSFDAIMAYSYTTSLQLFYSQGT